LTARFSAFLLIIAFMALIADSSFAQEEQVERYSESAIRRFEIITLMSLPFTSIHSYLIVRVIETARQGKVSPKFTDGDWRAVQVGAVVMALLVGAWDWLHTRSVDRNEPRIPNLERPEEEPGGETAMRVSAFEIKF
jgi:hypothetical protein